MAKTKITAKEYDFGAFSDSFIEVDEETRMVMLGVNLAHGVKLTVEAPLPVLAAWAIDNPAGSLLARSAQLKA